MKKFMIVSCVWMALLCTMLVCNSKSELQFKISYDSKTKETYKIKNEIQTIYTELINGVHEESYILMVLHNIDKFEYQDNMKASFQNNQLTIIEGDGKGDTITGELKTSSVCLPQVAPRSFLQELFGK